MPTLEQIRTQVSETKNKLEYSSVLSPEERLARVTELEITVSQIKKDLDSLKQGATPDKLQEIELLELEYNALQNQLNVFKEELQSLQENLVSEIENEVKEELKQEETNDNKKGWLGRQFEGLTSKEEWQSNPGKNVARIVGGVGAIWLGSKIIKGIGRLFKKKDNKESKDNSSKKKPWYKKRWGIGLIGVGSFFGLKAIVGKEKRNEWFGTDKDKSNATDNKTDTSNDFNIASEEETSDGNRLNNVGELLTKEEITKRNKYIEDSIKKATTIPVKIDYGLDKEVLEAKGCPKIIDFDVSSQTILFGDSVKLKMNIEQFKKPLRLGSATVKSLHIDKISIVGENIKFDYTGSGTYGIISKSEPGTEEVSKDVFLDIIRPYYKDNKIKYKVNMPTNEGYIIPISVEATKKSQLESGNNRIENMPPTDIDKEFLTLSKFKQEGYNIVGSGANFYMKKLNSMNPEYGSTSDVFGSNASAENQLEQYLGTIPSVVDKKFKNVGDFLKDPVLDGISNRASITSEKIADFLEQYKDNQYIGNMLGSLSQWLRNFLPQKETITKSKIEEAFKSDPYLKTQVSLIMWKISILKLYTKDMKNILENQLRADHPNWTDQEINKYIKENFLDKKLVAEGEESSALKMILEMGLGQALDSKREFDISIDKKCKILQNKIENTGKGSEGARKDRGEIKYNKTKQQIESYGIGTKIELLPNEKYKLSKGKLKLSIEFDSLDEAIRISNFFNRIDFYHKKSLLDNYTTTFENKMRKAIPFASFMVEEAPEFFYHRNYIGGVTIGPPGIAYTRGNRFERYFPNITGSDSLTTEVRESTLKKEVPTLFRGNNIDLFVSHINERIRYYDIGDSFWDSMKNTFAQIKDYIIPGS